jgi:hypothetical protein
LPSTISKAIQALEKTWPVDLILLRPDGEFTSEGGFIGTFRIGDHSPLIERVRPSDPFSSWYTRPLTKDGRVDEVINVLAIKWPPSGPDSFNEFHILCEQRPALALYIDLHGINWPLDREALLYSIETEIKRCLLNSGIAEIRTRNKEPFAYFADLPIFTKAFGTSPRPLTTWLKQLRAFDLVVAGRTPTEVARLIGGKESTIRSSAESIATQIGRGVHEISSVLFDVHSTQCSQCLSGAECEWSAQIRRIGLRKLRPDRAAKRARSTHRRTSS